MLVFNTQSDIRSKDILHELSNRLIEQDTIDRRETSSFIIGLLHVTNVLSVCSLKSERHV